MQKEQRGVWRQILGGQPVALHGLKGFGMMFRLASRALAAGIGTS
jgi:hypothetical protein